MSQPEPDGGDTVLAAVAYIIHLLTGLIVYLVADEDDTYARWHALQAMGLGVVIIVLGFILDAIGGSFGLRGPVPDLFLFGLVGSVWSLLAFILLLVLAIKAYQGESIRLPVIADIADDHA